MNKRTYNGTAVWSGFRRNETHHRAPQTTRFAPSARRISPIKPSHQIRRVDGQNPGSEFWPSTQKSRQIRIVAPTREGPNRHGKRFFSWHKATQPRLLPPAQPAYNRRHEAEPNTFTKKCPNTGRRTGRFSDQSRATKKVSRGFTPGVLFRRPSAYPRERPS